MENPLSDLVESQMTRGNPRMPFEEQCAFHAALMCGVRNEAVAVASSLSTSAVAYLRHAGERLGGQLRYPRVARERALLGDPAFIHKYLNPKIRDRLAVAINQIKTKKLAPKPPGAIRRNATAKLGRHDLVTPDGSKWAFLVKLTPEGFFYGFVLEPGRGEINPEHIRWKGDQSRTGRGFATSRDAWSVPFAMLKD